MRSAVCLHTLMAGLTMLCPLGSATADDYIGAAKDAVVGAAAQALSTKAPAFTLKGIDGKEYSLGQFAGKTVVLEWFNEGCPFVQKFYTSGQMQKLQKTYTDKGVIWLTIVSSAPGKQGYLAADAHKETQTKWKTAPTALLIDETGEVGKKYGAKTTPHMYIIAGDGSLVYQGAIDDTPSTESDDIPKAKNYVVEALDAIVAGKAVPIKETKPYGCSVKYAL